MGCGCNKKSAGASGQVLPAQAARQAVYQVIDASGGVKSEHSSAVEARKAAASVGGRVRVTSRSAS